MATGQDSASTLVEVIDLSNENVVCKPEVEHYPKQVSFASGDLTNDKLPLICGGIDPSGSFILDCHVPGKANYPPLQLKTSRFFSASVWTGEYLWITGGLNPDFSTWVDQTYLVNVRFPPPSPNVFDGTFNILTPRRVDAKVQF